MTEGSIKRCGRRMRGVRVIGCAGSHNGQGCKEQHGEQAHCQRQPMPGMGVPAFAGGGNLVVFSSLTGGVAFCALCGRSV